MKLLESMQGSLAELGKVKIGGKGEERTTEGGKKWRMPTKNSYFTITGCDRNSAGDLRPDEALMAKLIEKYGVDSSEDKGTKTVRRLREIPIALMSDEIDEVLSAAYCCYQGRVLVARCDGETCTWFRDKDGASICRETPCNKEHDKLDEKGNRRFKLHTKFVFAIAEGEGRFGGHYVFRTTSKISTEQILGGLRHIQSLTNGLLAGIPLRLVLRGVEVSPDGKPTTVYVVHPELRGTDLNQIQQLALANAQVRIHNSRELRAVGQQYRALLCAPGENEDAEEQADIATEFHPENIIDTTAKVTPELDQVAPQDPPQLSKIEEARRRGAKSSGKNVDSPKVTAPEKPADPASVASEPDANFEDMPI